MTADSIDQTPDAVVQPEEGRASIDVAAPPEQVWALVADVTRMGEWSPECVRAEWRGGATGPAPGARFHGYNKIATYEWDVPCVVVECEPGRRFSFRVPPSDPNGTVWTYDFEPAPDGGTRVTESFHAPFLNIPGSPSNFAGRYEMLVAGMEQTLTNLKAAAER